MWNPVIWRKVAWLIATAIVATGVYVSTALAMPGAGFTGTTLALGRFVDDIDVNNIQVSQPTDHNSIQAVVKGPVTLTAPKEVSSCRGRTGNLIDRPIGRLTKPAGSSQRTAECVQHGCAARVLQSLLHALEAHWRHHATRAGPNLCLHGFWPLYESVVSGMPHNRSIAGSLRGIWSLPTNNAPVWPLVASAALAEVMRGLWGDATNVAAQNVADLDSLEQHIADSFDLQGSLARRSIDYGHAVGAAVYQTSLDDGEDQSYLTNFPTDYVAPVCDGCWVPTTPVPMAMQPYWKDSMTPFVLTPGDCVMDGPPVFSIDPGSDAYQEALEVYVTKNNLTPEQITIARFWADGPGTINGPGHSLSTTSQILQLVHANLAEAAETYARVGLAVGDGVYAVWSSKYTYNWLRPITYIHDHIDPTWGTLLPTPPFPSTRPRTRARPAPRSTH